MTVTPVIDAGLITPVVVTRGDVDLSSILEVLGPSTIVWNNSRAPVDLRPFGTFAAAAVVRGPLMYVQDDDCIVRRWWELIGEWAPGHIVCNMAPDFQKAYADKLDKLIGHGGLFEVELVKRTFDRYFAVYPNPQDEVLRREPNRLFTALNYDRLIVTDVGHTDLPWASEPNRLWKQPGHAAFHREALVRAATVLDVERQKGQS